MPIIRYFVFVGSALLALLFTVDRYFPAATERAEAIDVDRSIIRIHSATRFPEKIVFDMSSRFEAPMAAAPVGPEKREKEPDQVASVPEQAASPLPSPPHEVAARRAAIKRHVRSARRLPERRLAWGHQDAFAGWW